MKINTLKKDFQFLQKTTYLYTKETNIHLSKYISLPLALLMFITSMSFSLDMHFCQDQLKSFNLFGEARSCHEKAKVSTCPHHQQEAQLSEKETSKKGCCENKSLEFELDQDKLLQLEKDFSTNLGLQYFVIGYVETFLLEVKPLNTKLDIPIRSTPHIPRDIYALLETYLL